MSRRRRGPRGTKTSFTIWMPGAEQIEEQAFMLSQDEPDEHHAYIRADGLISVKGWSALNHARHAIENNIIAWLGEVFHSVQVDGYTADANGGYLVGYVWYDPRDQRQTELVEDPLNIGAVDSRELSDWAWRGIARFPMEVLRSYELEPSVAFGEDTPPARYQDAQEWSR